VRRKERSTAEWDSLQRGIEGVVALPGSPGYDEARRSFNARFDDVHPQAIAQCATPQDVSETLAFVGRLGVETATRSGGHCFAGRSSTRGVLIDVSPMRSVSVSGGVATVGAGAPLGDVYGSLQAHGLTIPAGTCPSVGVAGLTLGGGLGILGRTYGVTSDHLIGAQIVLADGRILECDERHHDDLYWALRGAGAGNFGVVTSFDFRTVPAPEATNVHLAWPFSEAVAVIDAWQRWAPDGPDELAASLKVTATGGRDQPPSVDLYAALLEGGSDPMELFDQLIVHVGSDPASEAHERMSFPETRGFWAHLGAALDDAEADRQPQPIQPTHLFTKSEFFGRPLPREAITALVEAFARDQASGESRELDFMPWGGAYNRVQPDATAFVHRDDRFQLKHAAVVDAEVSTDRKEAARRWVGRSWASVHRWGSGRVFQNFADPDLEEWADAYYGPNYQRLVQIKSRYDPTGLFRFHQSLPVS
jgi:FAD/FMN-containing dehydrogenase